MLRRVLCSGLGNAIASTRCDGSQLAICQECSRLGTKVVCMPQILVVLGATSSEALVASQCDFLAFLLELVVQSARLLLDRIRQGIAQNHLS